MTFLTLTPHCFVPTAYFDTCGQRWRPLLQLFSPPGRFSPRGHFQKGFVRVFVGLLHMLCFAVLGCHNSRSKKPASVSERMAFRKKTCPVSGNELEASLEFLSTLETCNTKAPTNYIFWGVHPSLFCCTIAKSISTFDASFSHVTVIKKLGIILNTFHHILLKMLLSFEAWDCLVIFSLVHMRAH